MLIDTLYSAGKILQKWMIELETSSIEWEILAEAWLKMHRANLPKFLN